MTHDSFDTIAERPLSHFGAAGSVLRHRKTGAQILAVQNADPELVFGIIFETLPERANGVAHLLEHLVFRGSRRYPHTHLYSKLVQQTLLTGLNASTSSDSTLFHLSSADQADFSNLIHVVLDAVFHPLLLKADFLEERSIVASEMTGHHAVPANQILERVRHELLPGSVYAVDYGGTPKMIGSLTHTELQTFHAKHYEATTARLFLWGNFDLAARLDQLDRSLESFNVTAQPDLFKVQPLSRPKHISTTYSSSDQSSAMTGFGWAFDAAQPDLCHAMALGMLAEPDGPLRQSLEALGGRVIGPGFSTDTGLGTFEFALVGHPQEAATSPFGVMEQALRNLHEHKSPETWAHSMADRLEFELHSLGTRTTGPVGLRALNLIRGSWRHGANPLELLDFNTRISEFRKTIATTPQVLTRHLGEDLLNNPHRVSVSMRPRSAQEYRKTPYRLAKKALDPTDLGQSPALPFVSAPPTEHKDPSSVVETDGSLLHMPELDSGLARAELAVSLCGFDADQMELVVALEVVLADHQTFEGMAFSTRCWAGSSKGSSGGAWLSISGKSLPGNREQMLDHIFGLLHQPLPVTEVVHRRLRAAHTMLRSRLAGMGHLYCETRLRADTGDSGGLNERLGGVLGIEALERRLASPPEQLLMELQRLRIQLAEHAAKTLAIAAIAPEIARAYMPDAGTAKPSAGGISPLELPQFENIPTGSANFTTGQGLELQGAGSAYVAAHMLETGWLWDSVRVAGGAYSVRCTYDSNDEVMTLVSIRDSFPRNTLDQFAKAPIWLHKAAQSEMLAACIAAKLGHLTRPIRPELALSSALQRHFGGQTDAMLQTELESVRQVDCKAIQETAQRIDAGLREARTIVMGPGDALADLP